MQVLQLVFELLSIAVLLVGVGLIHFPSALIMTGLLGILACELRAANE